MISNSKITHFFVGLSLALSLALFLNIAIGFILTVCLAVGKEFMDYFFEGEYDYLDAVATTIGALLAVGLYQL